MSKPDSLKYQLIVELLQTMEAAGYTFGVEKHIHIQQLLVMLPEDTPIEDFREIIAPVICHNEQDQIFFRDIFPTCLERAKAVHDLVEEQIKKEEFSLLPLWITILGVFLLAALAEIVFEKVEEIGKPDEVQAIILSVEPDSTKSICIDAERLVDLDPIIDAWLCQDSLIRRGSSRLGVFSLEDNTCLRYQALDTIGQDTICVTLVDSTGHQSNIFFYPTLEKAEIPAPDTSNVPEITYTERAFPFPTAESIIRERLEIQPLVGIEAFVADNAWWLKPLLILLLGALLWLILKYRDDKRRKLIAEVETRDKAPYIWDIKIDGVEAIEMNAAFNRSIHQLRRRTLGDHFVLDIPKTVKATIEHAGMVNFAYSQQTRPPEYLLLIDRQHTANHQALVFDLLYRAFHKNEIIVERFFYDDDPRNCYNEAFPDGISIRELQLRFYNTRLLIFGNGYQLLNPLNGKPARWTEIFKQWKERALLTTRPTTKWGRDERRLGQLFHVLPASIQGLEFLIDQFDAGDDADFDSWPSQVKDAVEKTIQLEGSLIKSLQQHYSEEMMVWIAACSVYPSLHWDLSLHLGELLSTKENKLLQIDRLLDLSRLPWFSQGEIPKQARGVLVEWLEENHPEKLSEVREALHHVLQQTAPPEESAVWEEYSMNVALNEWLIAEDEKKKQALEDRIADLLEKGMEADFTIIKYLDRERSPLDFIVPDAWKKYVHKGGHSGLGLKEFWNEALYWALPIWLLAGIGLFMYQPEMECNGDLKKYDEKGEKEWRVDLDTPIKGVAALANAGVFCVWSENGEGGFYNKKGELLQSLTSSERNGDGSRISGFDVDRLNQRFLIGYENGVVEMRNIEGAIEINRTVDLPTRIAPGILKSIPGEDLFLNAWGTEALLMGVDGKERKTFRIQQGPVTALTVSPDGTLCAMSGTDNIVKIWSLDGEFKQSTPDTINQSINTSSSTSSTNSNDESTVGLSISALSFSPDGKILIAGSNRGVLLFFEVATGKLLNFKPLLASPINTITTSHKYVLIGDQQGFSMLCDYSGIRIRVFPPQGYPIVQTAINGKDQSVVLATQNGVVRAMSMYDIPISKYCLESHADQILWREYLAHKAITKKDHHQVEVLALEVDSIHQAAILAARGGTRDLAADTARLAFHQNLATEYYNIAVGFANDHEKFIQQSIEATSGARDSACLYFGRAAKLYLGDDMELQRLVIDFCDNDMPVVTFSVSNTECCAPCDNIFTNLTANADRYVWSFGNGTSSTDANPQVTYRQPGTYTVKLVAFKGSNKDSTSHVVLVEDCRQTPPRSDSDGDGFVDSEDECPYTPGQVKGCPDGDQDGVIDKNDKCPGIAGTITNYGCPEVDLEANRKEIIARLSEIIKKGGDKFYAKSRTWTKIGNPQITEYVDRISKEFKTLSESEINQRNFTGAESVEELAKEYEAKVDRLIDEASQYVEKIGRQGGIPEIESVRLQDLTIAAGETYKIDRNTRLAVGRLVMEKGSRILIGDEVSQFELAARIIDIAPGAMIDGAGVAGKNGRPGITGRSAPSCKDGGNGGNGDDGGKGTDGVDITLTIEEIQSLGQLVIMVDGGRGGKGGDGGKGGRGGSSKGGLFQICDCPAQDGGRGGRGGRGGNGGNGGDVIIRYKEGSNVTQQAPEEGILQQLRTAIVIKNSSGQPGSIGKGGQGGESGKVTIATCPAGNKGKPGLNGDPLPTRLYAKKGYVKFEPL